MPELPEVEVLVRHLEPLLKGKTVRNVQVRRAKVLVPTSVPRLTKALTSARFRGVSRRGKYLVFTLKAPRQKEPLSVIGHLGMTGRMYLQPAGAALPKHAAVVLELGRENFVFEDTRYFGRFTLDLSALEKLGPEPLGPEFALEHFARALKRSSQPVKVKLLDQCLVAGIGNIYASEALFRAAICPRLPARRLGREQLVRLHRTIREVLSEAIAWGSTVPLDFPGTRARDALFYYGSAERAGQSYTERLLVYDRAGQRCTRCGEAIKRLVQAGRSTYYCPGCQGGKRRRGHP